MESNLTQFFEHNIKSEGSQEKDYINNTTSLIKSAIKSLEHFELKNAERSLLEAGIWLYFLHYKGPDSHLHVDNLLNLLAKDHGEDFRTHLNLFLENKKKNKPPENETEAIFRDVITMHFTDLKLVKNNFTGLKDNIDLKKGSESIETWYKHKLESIETHKYVTTYGQTEWQPKKMKTIKTSHKKIRKIQKQTDKVVMHELGVNDVGIKLLKKKLLKAEAFPERGIETWFRTASKNLYTRRQIVDTKSNIMITMNAILLSLILGNLYSQLKDNPHIFWFLIPMILTNLLSMSFAIFATKPILASGIFTREEVDSKEARLTTFDDFYKVPLKEYEWAVGEMLQDRKFLYNTLIRDMYRLAVDLAKRYKNIKLSYEVFLAGLIFSVFMFGACYIIF